jgi:hypothetical protein
VREKEESLKRIGSAWLRLKESKYLEEERFTRLAWARRWASASGRKASTPPACSRWEQSTKGTRRLR